MRETLQKILSSGQTTMVLDARQIAPFTLLQEAAMNVTQKPEATRDKPGPVSDKLGAMSNGKDK